MGGVITKLVDTLTSGDVLNNLRTIFAGLVPVLSQVGDIISNMASGFMSLFAASLPAVKEFSFFMFQLSDGFTGWVEKIKGNGDLDRFLRDGINSFKLILNATLEWGGAIMQILKWALPMGLALAQGFFMAANAFNAWTNSMEGAAKIRSVIESFEPLIHTVGHLLVTLVKQLGSVIAEVLPLVEPVIAGITEIIPDIAAAFKLLAPIGLGIISALIPIVPMLMPIVEAVAKIASGFTTTLLPVVFELVGALGRIAPVVANVAGSFSNFIKIFGELIKPIETVVLVVGPMLVSLFNNLFPVLQSAVAVIGPLAAAFAISLADGIHDVAIALIPLIPAFQDFASRVMPIVTKQMDILKPIIMELVWKFVDIARAAMDMAASFIEWTDKAGILTPILKGLIALFVVSKVVNFTTAILKMMYAMTVGPIVGMTTALAKFILQLGSAAGVKSMSAALEALTVAETANARAPKKSPLFAAWKAWRAATTAQTTATTAQTVATGGLATAETAAVGPTGVLTGAIASLNAVLIANPIGIIVAAIVALVAGIVLLYFHWKPFRDLVDGTWQALQAVWDQFLVGAKVVGGALVDGFKALLPILKKVWDVFYGFYIQPMVEAFKFLARILTGDVSGAFKGLGDYVGSIWDSIKGFAGAIVDLAAGAGKAMLDFSKKLFSAGIDLLAGMLRGAISGSAKIIQFFLDLPMNILKAIPDIISWLWYKGLELISGFVNGMYNGIVLLVKFWVAAGKAIVGALTGSAKWLWRTGEDIVMGLWNGITSVWNTVLDFFVKLPRRIIDALTNAASWLYETGKSVLSGMWEGIKSGWHSVEDFFKALPARVMKWFVEARMWLRNTGIQILEGLRDGWNTGFANVKSFFVNLPKNIAKFLANARTWLANTGRSILNGLEDGIRNGWRSVQSFFTGLPGRIAKWFSDARKWLNTRGREILDGLLEGLTARVTAVIDWFKEVPDKIIAIFKRARKWLYRSGENILMGLWDGLKGLAAWVGKRFKEVLKAIIPDALEKQFGIASPSKVMAKYGGYLMEGLGNGIVQGANSVESSMTTLFTKMTAQTAAYTPPPVAAPTMPTAQLVAGIDAMRATAVAKAAELSTQFGNALGTGVTAAGVSAKASANIAGQNVVIGMQNGLVSNGQIITQAAFDRGKNAVANINAGAGTAAGASVVSSVTGQNVIAGLINGMVGQGVPLAEAAAKLGLSVPEAMNNALVIKSPSKVMFAVGENASIGFADGLDSQTPRINRFFDNLNRNIEGTARRAAKAGETYDRTTGQPVGFDGQPINLNDVDGNTGPPTPPRRNRFMPAPAGRSRGREARDRNSQPPAGTRNPDGSRMTPEQWIAAQQALYGNEEVNTSVNTVSGGWDTLNTENQMGWEYGNGLGNDSQGRTQQQQLEAWVNEQLRQNAEKWYAAVAAQAFDNAEATGVSPMADIGVPIADIEEDKKKKADDALAALMLAIAESLKIIASIDWTAANSVRRPVFGQANVVTTMLGGDKVPGAGLASSAGLGVAPKPMTAYSGNYVGSPNANFAGMGYVSKNLRGIDPGFRGPSLEAMAKPTIASADNGLRSSTNVSAAVVDTGAKQVSQLGKVLTELQAINQTIGNVRTAPLIGKIEQNDVGTRSAPEDIIQAALKASALIGR
jgi:phage-related protein